MVQLMMSSGDYIRYTLFYIRGSIRVFQNRALFERYGRVVEADVMTDKNFGFVHVDASMGNLADYKQNIET